MAGDGVVVKGKAYGIRSIRVDGNDALAVYSATRAAREMAITEQKPILIEVKIQLGCLYYTLSHILHLYFFSSLASQNPKKFQYSAAIVRQ